MFNMYILLRSYLRTIFSIIATETSQYLYFTAGCLQATQLFHITRFLSHLITDFCEVETPVDPERQIIHYSRVATCSHVCLSPQKGVEPLVIESYMSVRGNLYRNLW